MSPSLSWLKLPIFHVHSPLLQLCFFLLFGRENSGLGLGNGSSHLGPALPVPNGFGTDNLDLKEGWGLKSTNSKYVLIVSFT
jgi:hypothetical protein